MPYRRRPSLPPRCASLPPLHLECPELAVLPLSGLSSLPEEEECFPWARLPKEIQHDILRNALAFPVAAEQEIHWGWKEHKAHLLETVVPLFLGLGNWNAYLDAAAILYGDMCITRTANRDAILNLLWRPETLRIRNLIHKLELHVLMPYDLKLFNIGLETQGNIPTALQSMRVHGRLQEVNFVFHVPDLTTCDYDHACMMEYDVLSLNLPMARLQVASCCPPALPQDSSTTVSRAIQPGKVVVAPAFLASRDFQSGLLPLLEKDVFQKSTLTMKLFSTKDDRDSRVASIDGHDVFTHWFGTTKLEDLPQEAKWLLPRERPNDLYPFVPQAEESHDVVGVQIDEDGDETRVEVAEKENATPHPQHEQSVEAIEYRERGDDLLSSPVIFPEMSIDSNFSLSSQTLEDLHRMITRTAAEVAGENGEPCSQDNALPLQKDGSLLDSDQFSPCVEAASSGVLVPTSDIAETVETELTIDSIVASGEKEAVGYEAPATEGPQNESIVAYENVPENPDPDVAREITPRQQTMSTTFKEAETTATKPGASNMDEDDTDTSSDSDSETESSSDSDSEINSSKDTMVEHAQCGSQSIEHAAAASSRGSDANGRLLDQGSDSDSSDESSEEYPPSRSAAFAKKKPSPHKLPIQAKETRNSSGNGSSDSSDDTDSTDSSSSEDDNDPKSPTIEVSRHAVEQQPVESSLCMSGALPSSDLSSSSSSDSDSEDSSDSSDTSSDEEGRISSTALSQMSQVFGERAGLGYNPASVTREKAAADTSSTTSESDSDSSSSDSSTSSSDSSSSESPDTEDERPCPKCGKIQLGEVARKSMSQSGHKIPPVRPEARSASQASRPGGGKSSSQSTAANTFRTPSVQPRNPRGASFDNTTRPSQKRKTPPQLAESTLVSKIQRKRRRRNMAQQKRQSKSEPAQQAGRR